MPFRALAVAIAALPLLGESARAVPPTDAQIEQAVAKHRAVLDRGPVKREDLVASAHAALAGLDVREMTGVQLGVLANHYNILEYAGQWEAAKERLRSFLPDRGADGASAAVRLLGERLRAAGDEKSKLALLRDIVTHPGLEEAIRRGGATRVLGILGAESGTLAAQLGPELESLDRLLTPELAPLLAPDYIAYFELRQRSGTDGPREAIEQLRQKLVRLAREAAAREGVTHREFIASVADYLDGRHVRGQLLGHAAPGLTVLWSSDPAIRSLDDLRGRVVVLDFWATWCGPCVATFPQVRELEARYRDYPVTILGVSSPQGSVVGLDGGAVKADSPEHEFGLMRRYIEEKQVTWPLIFTREPVTNPDYGVRGIPHVVIIDPKGVVRHRGLHPAEPLAKKAAKIDALLTEFGLAAPPPPAQEPAPSPDR
ncbi:MAG TPA: TlpA disulfide reductase family protein [Phycisphaerales bacterium]|nr:TlpA disulfide reductase family protein [Phycisphaerales bacterium]